MRAVPPEQLVLESVHWVQQRAVVCSASIVEEQEEQGDAILLVMTWTAGDPARGEELAGVEFRALPPAMIEVGCWQQWGGGMRRPGSCHLR